MMIEALIIAVCMVMNAMLAAVEIAFVTVGKPALRESARTGSNEAQRALSLRERPERTLSVIQIGATLVASISAAVGGAGALADLSPWMQRYFELSKVFADLVSICVVIIPLTYLNVLLGELVPKTLALRHPLRIVLRATHWLSQVERLLSPLISALEWSTRRVVSLFKLPGHLPELPSGETVELGTLSTQAREYVVNLVKIEKKRVREVFVPWENVVFVEHDQSALEVEVIILRSGHTRLPVLLRGAVIGIINTKEFLALRADGQEKWGTVIRPALRVQESDTLLRAFRAMQEIRSHLSIVYQGPKLTGIVTMEDILEEIIGEIYDEDDDARFRRILTSGRIRNARCPP